MKRQLTILTILLLVLGVAIVLWALFGNQMIGADATTLVPTEQDTLNSFLTFGGAMIGAAVVFFILLARMG